MFKGSQAFPALKRSAAWGGVVVAAFAFGAGDQYLGSLRMASTFGFWTVSVSLLSAPWLILPFLAGCSRRSPSQAALIGLLATLTALAGYFVMIIGPLEGGQWSFTHAEVTGLLLSNRENIFGGMVTGPLFGFLGQQWRVRRAWFSGVVVALALCLEPIAHTLRGESYPDGRLVWTAEALAGVFVGIAFSWFRFRDAAPGIGRGAGQA